MSEALTEAEAAASLSRDIDRLNNGKSIILVFCDHVEALYRAFGGRKNFIMTISELDTIKLMDPSMVAIID